MLFRILYKLARKRNTIAMYLINHSSCKFGPLFLELIGVAKSSQTIAVGGMDVGISLAMANVTRL